MKYLGGVFLAALFYASITSAALPPSMGTYAAPTAESVTVLRGTTTLCTTSSPVNGVRGLSFIQLGKGRCPPYVFTPVGWDRPEEEADSPGIPFQHHGL